MAAQFGANVLDGALPAWTLWRGGRRLPWLVGVRQRGWAP